MIRAMSQGESDPAKLAALSRGRLKADFAQLVEALSGQLNENQRWLLKRLLGQVENLENEIAIYSERIKEQMLPYQKQRVPAVNRRDFPLDDLFRQGGVTTASYLSYLLLRA
jgi:hypothetical protein